MLDDDEATVFSIQSKPTEDDVSNVLGKPVLSIIEGTDQGKFFSFEQSITLGRSKTADIVIDDDQVSRVHVKISIDDEQFIIEDLDSSNGTKINGIQLQCPTPLSSGSAFKIGDTLINCAFKTEAQLEQDNRNKQTHESIENAAFIQNTVLSDSNVLQDFVREFFIFWQPRDVVSGDIYLIETISDSEILILVIDCVGHGVSGAFITMSIKAIAQQIISALAPSEVSPANILSQFNEQVNHLAKQNTEQNKIGFDGGIIYYNNESKLVRYSGSCTSLFCVENKQVNILKGSNKSIGFNNNLADFQFKEHEFTAHSGLSLYLSTDGYLDQIGGAKNFPFGRRRFVRFLSAINHIPMPKQEIIFEKTMTTYQTKQQQRDDMTVVGLRF